MSDIPELWRSALSARVPECQKLEMVGLYGAEYSKCNRIVTLGFKGVKVISDIN